jgi:hypothetical protein
MANFTLNWSTNINGTVLNQQAEYRQKSIGGAYLTTGFIPANPLSSSAITTSINSLTDNIVYQFRVSNLCTLGNTGYTAIEEGIKFACVTPTETHTSTSIQSTVSSLPSDIIKVRHTLYNSLGTVILQGPIEVVTIAGISSNNFTGLTPLTSYIIKVELVANVDGAEVVSNLGTCQVSVTTSSAIGDTLLINGSDQFLINGSDILIL